MRRAVPVLLASIPILCLPAACNFSGAVGSAGLGCHPARSIAADNSTHGFFEDHLVPQTAAAMTFARAKVDATSIKVLLGTSYSPKVDVHVEDAAYATYCGYTWVSPEHGGVAALTTCDVVDSAACDRHHVRLSRLVSEGDTTAHVRNMALHESLHTLGLEHIDDSADVMYGGGITNVTSISAHDRRHIDAYYS